MFALLALIVSFHGPDVSLYNATRELWSRAVFDAHIRCVENGPMNQFCWTQVRDTFYVMNCRQDRIEPCVVSIHGGLK